MDLTTVIINAIPLNIIIPGLKVIPIFIAVQPFTITHGKIEIIVVKCFRNRCFNASLILQFIQVLVKKKIFIKIWISGASILIG